jgi:hypothetical protein
MQILVGPQSVVGLTPLDNKNADIKPSQAKVLTGGGDLREAQVDVPFSVSHFCV